MIRKRGDGRTAEDRKEIGGDWVMNVSLLQEVLEGDVEKWEDQLYSIYAAGEYKYGIITYVVIFWREAVKQIGSNFHRNSILYLLNLLIDYRILTLKSLGIPKPDKFLTAPILCLSLKQYF